MSKQAPDLVGDRKRADMVHSALLNLQLQREDLKIRQLAEGHGGGDPSGVALANGQPVSYDERRVQIDEAEQRLLSQTPKAVLDVLDEVLKANPPQ